VAHIPARWQVKAAIQRCFSTIPGGHHLNYVCQRTIGGVPLSEERLETEIAYGVAHITNLERYAGRSLAELRMFEFGAGFDLHHPLHFASRGALNQVVVDIRPLMRPRLVLDIASRLDRRWADRPDHRVLGRPQGTLSRWLEGLGLHYRAPADARATALPPGSVDAVTSTNTLEHIPERDIGRILAELRRILAPDGVLSFQIDYRDHYSYADPTVGPYHFLTIDDRTWNRRYNSSLHYQNRLRHADYLRLFDQAGFEVVVAQLVRGSAEDEATLRSLPLAERFRSRPLTDLAVLGCAAVLRHAP
jgi:SAM-dependent methyltransferase